MLSHLFFSLLQRTPRSTLFPYTTLFRSGLERNIRAESHALQTGEAIDFDRASSSSGRRSVEVDSLPSRSEEHTSELQSLTNLVCRLLLEKKKISNRPIGKPLR